MKFITLGSDPEFFVYDPKGQPFPATLFAKGTKDNPSAITELGEWYFEQLDNISFEGNIPKAYTRQEFVSNMVKIRKYFSDKVTPVGYSLSPNGVEYFAKRYLKTREACDFGCSTVIDTWLSNMYTGFETKATPRLDNYKFRVAGFHIHIGYDEPILKGNDGKIYTDIMIGRLFDLFLTIPSHEIKPEIERIKTYGRWGVIRSKTYGVECRTLSSYYTQEQHLSWVWDQVMKIESFINLCTKEDLYVLYNKSYITSDLISDMKLLFKSLLQSFKNYENLKQTFNEIKDL